MASLWGYRRQGFVASFDRPSARAWSLWSNHNPLDFIERDLIAGAVIELGCSGALVVGNLMGVLDGAAVLEVSGDAGGP